MHYNPPKDTALDIIYCDDTLLVINKPGGLLSVPGRGEDKYDSLIVRIQKYYPDALIVHRLDMSTSGLMVIALGKENERAISILFQQRKVKKKYIAVVDGLVLPQKGEINLPLLTDWPNRPKQKVNFKDGKPSLTQYRVLSFNTTTTRLELTPVTGRSHQLRVHMQSLGHAILGDELYARKEAVDLADRLLLHASYLSFQHPKTGDKLTFNSEADF